MIAIVKRTGLLFKLLVVRALNPATMTARMSYAKPRSHPVHVNVGDDDDYEAILGHRKLWRHGI